MVVCLYNNEGGRERVREGGCREKERGESGVGERGGSRRRLHRAKEGCKIASAHDREMFKARTKFPIGHRKYLMLHLPVVARLAATRDCASLVCNLTQVMLKILLAVLLDIVMIFIFFFFFFFGGGGCCSSGYYFRCC